jgi:polysaccharide biosynthesis protein PelD
MSTQPMTEIGELRRTRLHIALSSIAERHHSSPLRFWRVPETTPRRILESIGVVFLLFGIGYAVDQKDPFFLGAAFSWVLVAPLLVSLRHGFALGFGSAVGVSVALVMAWRTQAVSIDRFPGEPLVGLFAVAAVVGQFSDGWTRRVALLERGSSALRRQLEELSRSHFLLELSHERLDEQLDRTASSLREAIAAVKDLRGSGEGVTAEREGEAMIAIFAAHCGLEVAELRVVDEDTVGARCAALGHPELTREDDPLALEAIRTGHLVHVPAARLDEGDRTSSPLLAAVPFVDASGRTRAILCVQAMPFIAFNEKNLEAMAMLGRHLADVVAGATPGGARGSRASFEARFAATLRAGSPEAAGLVTRVTIRRGPVAPDVLGLLIGGALPELDQAWVVGSPDGDLLVHGLLPIGEDVAFSFESAVAELLARSLDLSLERAGVTFRHHVLRRGDTVTDTLLILDRRAEHHELDRQSLQLHDAC